jgi:hypothetical protein
MSQVTTFAVDAEEVGNLRLRPEAAAEIARFREYLKARVRLGVVTVDSALAAHHDAMTQIVANPAAWEVDDRDWTPLRCRDCGRATSALKGHEFYACRCQPSKQRAVYTDRVDRDGHYVLDLDALAKEAA